MTTKVIFRKFSDGDVIALFPEVPADNYGWLCESYMHIGQHGGASPYLVYHTKLASESDYADLLAELIAIGYDDLQICKRFAHNASEVRRAALS